MSKIIAPDVPRPERDNLDGRDERQEKDENVPREAQEPLYRYYLEHMFRPAIEWYD